MKSELTKLVTERNRIAADLKNGPVPTNYEGKALPEEPTIYLLELDKKIAKLRGGK